MTMEGADKEKLTWIKALENLVEILDELAMLRRSDEVKQRKK